jgi:hypothetical protein
MPLGIVCGQLRQVAERTFGLHFGIHCTQRLSIGCNYVIRSDRGDREDEAREIKDRPGCGERQHPTVS